MKQKDTDSNYGNFQEVVSQNWIRISDAEFDLLSNLVYNKIGINLTKEKRTLLMGRLQKILRQKNLSSFKEYYEYVLNDHSGSALSELANYISTNHTFFWREADHFEYFQKLVLPQIIQQLTATKTKDIRVWSAGCSSGEEPYILVMLMMEFLGSNYKNFDAGVLATDISEKALDIAKAGKYSADRLKEMPKTLVNKYFTKISSDEYEVIDKVKNEVTFRRFNLMNKEFPFRKQFHTIFCRNVMIYFDDPTRDTLVEKFYNLTIPGGSFFIGHSETLKRTTQNSYEFVKPAFYRKPM